MARMLLRAQRSGAAISQACLVVSLLASCAHPRLLSSEDRRGSAPATACPFGRDYGSGMVALGLPPDAHKAFTRAHQVVANMTSGGENGEKAAGPYAPHVSLVYGVNESNREAVAARLIDFANGPRDLCLEVDKIENWPLGNGRGSVLVAVLSDWQGRASALHEDLQRSTGQAALRPYRAHVTLGYLTDDIAPPRAAMDELCALLQGRALRLRVLWMTDRCGLPTGYAALAAQQRTQDRWGERRPEEPEAR